jgi:hypothetical protein
MTAAREAAGKILETDEGQNWGTESSHPMLTSRSKGILTRFIFGSFREIEFSRILLKPTIAKAHLSKHVECSSRL